MTNKYVFRANSSYVWFGITTFLLLFLVIETVWVERGWQAKIASLAMTAVVGMGAYMIFLRPCVIVFDEGITVVNPMVTVTVGWAEVDAIETKYAMSVERNKAVTYAWAAPAPGRHHRRNVDPTEMRGMGHGGHEIIRPGDDPNTLSGSAAAIARRRWHEFSYNNATSASYRKETYLVGPIVVVASASVALFVR